MQSQDMNHAATSQHDLHGEATVRHDVLLAVLAGVATVLVGARFNFGERLLHALSRYELIQLDEWPIALLVAVLALLWFAVRRSRQAARALRAAQAARFDLDHALQDNRRLAAEYVRVQEAERRSLAAELHDELGQYLTAVKLAAVALRSGPGAAADPRAAAVESIIRNMDHVSAVVVGLIRQLRPVALDTLGLQAALEHGVAEWRARLPALSIDVEFRGELTDLGEAANLTVYRLVQEALTNVMKHSGAQSVHVAVARDPGTNLVTVDVADDGVGASEPAPDGGFGLMGMRERAAALGGTLVLRTRPGGGFAVHAELPVPPTRGTTHN